MPTATKEKPARAQSPAPATTWEADFREALEAVQAAGERTYDSPRGPATFGPYWHAIMALCRAFCVRPAPAKFVTPLEIPIQRLMTEWLAPACRMAHENRISLHFQQDYVIDASEEISAIIERVAVIDSPPLRKRETVDELLRFDPPISLDQLCKMCPHLTREEIVAWHDWKRHSEVFYKTMHSRDRAGNIPRLPPPPPEPRLAEFPEDEPAPPELPPITKISPELANALGEAETAFATVADDDDSDD